MAQQAPFGTDEQIRRAFKIVGGKQHEVSALNVSTTRNVMSRTPYKHSDRPPWYLDACRTEQFGPNKLFLKSITKPNDLPNDSKIVVGKNGSPDDEEMQLLLSRLLAEYPSSIFKNIRTDLLKYDLCGLIPKSSVESCFKKFNVPLPPSVMKSVLQQFIPENYHDMVNYESLINYLFPFSAKTEQYHVRKTSNAMKLDLNPQITPPMGFSRNFQPNVSLTSSTLVKKAMDDRDKAYLLVQTEQAFKRKGSKILGAVKQLRDDLKKLSNGNDYVMLDQVERRCSFLGFPLNHTLLEKILERFNVKDDNKINWEHFLDFIEKAVPFSLRQSSSAFSQSSIADKMLPFWESQTPLALQQALPRKSVLGKDSSKDILAISVTPKQRKEWDIPTMNDNGKLERPYEILKVEEMNSGAGATPKTSDCDAIESNGLSNVIPDTTATESITPCSADSKSGEFKRFSFLKDALAQSDTQGKGTLPRHEAFRIVSKNCLLHKINIPWENVRQAIESCTLANNNDVVIDKLTIKLWNSIK